MINIITGNHFNVSTCEDFFGYLAKGLSKVNADYIFTESFYKSTGINIVLEFNAPDFYFQLAKLRTSYPRSKLYMIVTEIFDNGMFNSAGVEEHNSNKSCHYLNTEYWRRRTDDFLAILPYLDGLIAMSEIGLEQYSRLGKKLFFLGYAYSSELETVSNHSLASKDIDILFSGTNTPHRSSILDRFVSAGLNVVKTSPLPEYLRSHYHARARLVVGLKLSENSGNLSKNRAFYCLINGLPHLFEHVPTQTDISQFLNFCPPDVDFVNRAIDLLKNRHPYPSHLFDLFRESTQNSYEKLFNDLQSFLMT